MERVRRQLGVTDRLVRYERKHSCVVAVLDTGASVHPDLDGKLLGFRDFINGKEQFYDDNGHGTHVCGIIAGSGKLSGGRFRGMAPESRIIMGKILDQNGQGSVDYMIEGLKWILDLHEHQPVDIINISVGMSEIGEESKRKQVRELIHSAWKKGILIICAAGNTGPAPGSLSTLSKMPEIIVVGCNDGGYITGPGCCASYSASGDVNMKKPDLVAPGTGIVSCNFRWASGRGMQKSVPYIKKSGTSMATAIVTGAVALWMNQNGTESPGWLKTRLLTSCTDLREPCYRQGWGMLNVTSFLENIKRH